MFVMHATFKRININRINFHEARFDRFAIFSRTEKCTFMAVVEEDGCDWGGGGGGGGHSGYITCLPQ